MRGEREERTAEDAGDAAGDEPGPAMGGVADTVADGQGADDGDESRGGVEECRVGRGEAEGFD